MIEVFCTHVFFSQFHKLKKNKSYNDIEQELIDTIINSNIESLKNGVRLTGSVDTPFIKKRLGGRSGYRIYYLILIKDDKVYLTFIHPKTGSMGADNITNQAEKDFLKDVIDCIKSNHLYSVICENNRLIFNEIGNQSSS